MKISEILKHCPEVLTYYLEELSNIGMVLIDNQKIIHDCNQGFLNMLGFKEKPLMSNIKNILSKNSQELILPKNSLAKINLLFTGNNNEEILLKGYIFPAKEYYLLIFEQHKLTYIELITKMSQLNDQIVNMTRELEKKNIQLKEALNTVKRIMNTDPLTGVLNRRAFKKILKREIAFSIRHKLPLSFVLIDIDYFKQINDTYGHEVGDLVLKKFAKTLKKSTRQEDIIVRMGGDEFALALPNTNLEKALKTSERIRQLVEKIKISPVKDKITASFGITELQSTDDDISLKKRADEALYEAKRKGRNRCESK